MRIKIYKNGTAVKLKNRRISIAQEDHRLFVEMVTIKRTDNLPARCFVVKDKIIVTQFAISIDGATALHEQLGIAIRSHYEAKLKFGTPDPAG